MKQERLEVSGDGNRICSKCAKKINSHRTIECNSCYMKNYKAKAFCIAMPKVCQSCGSVHFRKRNSTHCKPCADQINWKKRYRENSNKEKIRGKEYRRRNNELIKQKDRYKRRIKKGLDPNTPLLVAPKGSGYLNKNGYKVFHVKGHANAFPKNGAIFEHTLVMSEHLRRPLKKTETVHHKNGIRYDNRIDNLELWDKRHGPGQRVEDKIKWCTDFLNDYGYKVLKRG